MTQTRSLAVPEGLEGERLDAALARMFGLSRTKAAELIEDGLVLVDGNSALKSHRVSAQAWLEVQLPPPPGTEGDDEDDVAIGSVAAPQDVPGLTVIHDDDDVVVVDKPVGVASHPSPGWTGPTVVQGLAGAGYRISTSGAAERQGIVHRLDVGTSGLMVVAKSERAYSHLKRAFRERTVEKTYHALVQGHPDPTSGTIDAPIDRHPHHDYRFAVVTGGKPSITHYDTIEAFRHGSLLEVGLETGRTHQIRVHMSAMRHPCVGDLTYGADPVLAKRLGLTRQWLHAMRLGFEHPGTGLAVTFESTYPDDLAAALATIAEPA
jgi:23S rRNA pseudouridine1911/1915/1917 synthase